MGKTRWRSCWQRRDMSGGIMATRKRFWLRVTAYLLLGVIVAVCVLLIFSEDRINETNFKRILTGMSQEYVNRILGGPPTGISKHNYWPLDAAVPRKMREWRGSLQQISIAFDDDGKVLAASLSPARPETLSEKVARLLRLPWW